MGERLTCILLGFMAGEVCGFLAHAGRLQATPLWQVLSVALVVGGILSASGATLTALSKADQFFATVALFGLILGALAGGIGAIGVIVLPLPWFISGPILGLLAGRLLCAVCGHSSGFQSPNH